MELVDNARLTNTSLTCNQDHLTLTLACHLPAVPQRPHLIVTPDKPCQSTRRRALEPRAQRSQANNLVKLYCFAYALDLGWTQRPEVEIAFTQLPCRFSNCDRAGRCQCLHPRASPTGCPTGTYSLRPSAVWIERTTTSPVCAPIRASMAVCPDSRCFAAKRCRSSCIRSAAWSARCGSSS